MMADLERKDKTKIKTVKTNIFLFRMYIYIYKAKEINHQK